MPDIATTNAIALEALDEQLDRHDASVTLGTRAPITDDNGVETEGAADDNGVETEGCGG